MKAMESWRWKDPALVYERIQAQEQAKAARSAKGRAAKAREGIEDLFEEGMTEDQSEQVEHLLTVWYDYERSYMPALGAPRVSVSCRGHDTGDVHDTGSDRDEKLNRITAEAVGACVDELHYLQRAAIGVHFRNRHARASVHKNPRIEDQHRAYQEARQALCPKLKRKGLVK